MTDIDAGEATAVRRRPPGGATTNLIPGLGERDSGVLSKSAAQ